MKALIRTIKTMSPGGRLAMALSFLWVFSLAACGYSGGCLPGCGARLPTPVPVKPQPPPRLVTITLTEYAIKMPHTLPPGLTRFEVTNAGNRAHYLEIERRGTDVMFGLNLLPGNTKTVEIILAPGQYRVWCPFNRDEAKGMELVLTVKRALQVP